MNYTKHTIIAADRQAVQRAMDNMLTQGEQVKRFEEELATYCGAKFAVACSSGTSALWMAYKAIGLMPWDSVLVPTITFVATANMVEAHMAGVEFADCTHSGHMDLSGEPRQVSCVAPVHMAGDSVDMERLWKAYSHVPIVEDAAHALGGSYQGQKIGGCTYSDLCCFSFHPSKTITTAEGGAVLTNNRHLYEALLQARNHGFLPGTHKLADLGFNFRMNELSAALGREQLKRVDEFVGRRREIAQFYVNALDGLLEVPIVCEEGAHHLFVVRTPKRDKLREELKMKGIGTQVHYQPVHTQPYYDIGDTLPNAEAYYKEALSLPLYPSMTREDTYRVVGAIEEALV